MCLKKNGSSSLISGRVELCSKCLLKWCSMFFYIIAWHQESHSYSRCLNSIDSWIIYQSYHTHMYYIIWLYDMCIYTHQISMQNDQQWTVVTSPFSPVCNDLYSTASCTFWAFGGPHNLQLPGGFAAWQCNKGVECTATGCCRGWEFAGNDTTECLGKRVGDKGKNGYSMLFNNWDIWV